MKTSLAGPKREAEVVSSRRAGDRFLSEETSQLTSLGRAG